MTIALRGPTAPHPSSVDDGDDVRIEGETLFSNTIRGGSSEFAPALRHAGVRYRWYGEESYGLMERSMPVNKLER